MIYFITIVFVLFSVSDGLLALYSKIKKKNVLKLQESQQMKEKIIVDAINNYSIDEEQIKEDLKVLIVIPPEVKKMRGFTVRGNPFLSRRKYSNLKDIDKKIERIISPNYVARRLFAFGSIRA